MWAPRLCQASWGTARFLAGGCCWSPGTQNSHLPLESAQVWWGQVGGPGQPGVGWGSLLLEGPVPSRVPCVPAAHTQASAAGWVKARPGLASGVLRRKSTAGVARGGRCRREGLGVIRRRKGWVKLLAEALSVDTHGMQGILNMSRRTLKGKEPP